MLTAGLTANLSAASNQSYIQGPLTRLTNTTGTYAFPVGGLGEERTAYVTPVSGAPSSYTVYYHHAAPTINSVLDASLAGIQINEYWDITRNSGADAVIGMEYRNPNGLAAGAATTDWSGNVNPCWNCNVAVVNDDASGNWYFTGALGATGFAPNESTYWQSNNIVNSRQLLGNFGQFTFGYAYAIILPVQLISFTGSLQTNNALLEWKYAHAAEVVSTELQHSTDGNHFEKIAIVHTVNSNTYNYIHFNLKTGAHFYRLLIKDKAGKITYSQTVLLVTNNNITVIKGLRPTMVHSETFIDVHSARAQTVHVIMMDITGRRVAETSSKLIAGENSIKINAQLLANGLYMLQVITEDAIKANLRFIKE
jgi:hypothetical protein